MHAPDGFFAAGTALTTGAVSFATVGVVIRRARQSLNDRQLPLTGMAASFIFAAQMINFPVAAGTTGHLIGGALAAVLLGPGAAVIVLATVVLAQAFLFADGGISALGYNVLNLAIVAPLGGYAAFRITVRTISRLNPAGPRIAVAAGVAGFASVMLSAMAFSIEWLFGASAPVPFDTFSASILAVHIPISLAEGVITGLVLSSIMAVRPDLVYGATGAGLDNPAPGADIGRFAAEKGRARRNLSLVGVTVALLLAAVFSQWSATDPDGFERVTIDLSIAPENEVNTKQSPRLPLADYAVAGIDNEPLSLGLAGAAGVTIVFATGAGLASAIRPSVPGRSKTGVANDDHLEPR